MRRVEARAAVSRESSPVDTQLTRAFIAVVLGLVYAFWLLQPSCKQPSVHAMLPEFRVLTGIPSLVI
jgi:hypothetical protein